MSLPETITLSSGDDSREITLDQLYDVLRFKIWQWESMDEWVEDDLNFFGIIESEQEDFRNKRYKRYQEKYCSREEYESAKEIIEYMLSEGYKIPEEIEERIANKKVYR
jgi:hypothetical protein